MYDKQIFSDNLRYYMKKFKETQSDVAKLLNISKSNVSAYISGDQIPRMDKIAILCEHYAIKVSDLLEQNTSPYHKADGMENQLLQIFQQLDDEGKRLAIGMLRTLLTEHAQKNNTYIVNEVTR